MASSTPTATPARIRATAGTRVHGVCLRGGGGRIGGLRYDDDEWPANLTSRSRMPVTAASTRCAGKSEITSACGTLQAS